MISQPSSCSSCCCWSSRNAATSAAPARRRPFILHLLLITFTLASLNLIIIHHYKISSSQVVVDDAPPDEEEGKEAAAHYLTISNSHDSNKALSNNNSREERGKGNDDDDDDDNDIDSDDPFATQKPQGDRWTRRRKTITTGKPHHYWWRNSDSCFEVDNICRSSQNEWFYYYHHNNNQDDDNDHNKEDEEDDVGVLFQPTMELKYMPYAYARAVYADVRVKMVVMANHRISWERLMATNNDTTTNNYGSCRRSSAAYHIVLHSLYNDMVGEFYLGTLSNMYSLLTRGGKFDLHTNNITSFEDGKEETQFYIHIPYENKRMVDAHRLLLLGMFPILKNISTTTTSPAFHSVRWARSALDLIRPKRRKRACQCYRKLVFCGYNTYVQKNVAAAGSSAENHTHNNTTYIQKKDAVVNASAPNHTPNSNAINSAFPSPQSSLPQEVTGYYYNYTLWPGKQVDSSLFDRSSIAYNRLDGCSRDRRTSYHCQKFAMMRKHLITNILSLYPNIEDDIIRHRKDVLLERGLIDKHHYVGDTMEWTFVGLTQRTSRRSWLNLSNITEVCDATFLLGKDITESSGSGKKILCVEVNVETSTSPRDQLVVHRSLDALVGIHGAQLTQAILLRPNAFVLELLPWIPKYTRGDWVSTTTHPTPLGILFYKSDLNHFGYSLDRQSVPMCNNLPNEEEEKLCFMSKENEWKFNWANRNFVVEENVVIHFIRRFVLPMKEDETCQCKDLLNAQGDRFVLYNVYCEVRGTVTSNGKESRPSATANITARHYFRKTVSQHKGIAKPLLPSETATPLLPMCPLPLSNPAWNYYRALVHENLRTADRARQLTHPPTKFYDEGQGSEPRIPHRLIFTHKDNLFDCSKSASMSTSPDIFNLAENAKATVNAYSKIWPDLEFRFLTDKDCVEALNQTQPGLIQWFNSGMAGMYKADLCRAAYLTLHGGYYFDVDLLVVHPFVAPHNATFVTVKGMGFPKDGFFQAFLAAEKGNDIVRRSLQIMEDALWEERPKGKYLGPTALMEAWIEVNDIHNPLNVDPLTGVHLLKEVSILGESASRYKKLEKEGLGLIQHVPKGHGDACQFSSGACNVIVIDDHETLYFYSRVLGTTWCGKRISEYGECK